MKIELRSGNTANSRRMAGARALWRANGMKEEHFGKPIIAVVNSFTQMVPGHVHLHKIGQQVKKMIEARGCFAAEMNTIAIDDGIAMGHQGMLYSLPSREIIADSIEYMINAHRIDAMVCISNCDKITPGMLMAAMRLNIPTVMVSGGPMEAGNFKGRKVDLIDVMVDAAAPEVQDSDIEEMEKLACPGCGSCSGMFTANSMNCLAEALGMALPGNGTILATHKKRSLLFEKAANLIVDIAHQYYNEGNQNVLPRAIATKEAFLNAMTLDIAMGGSTNTVLHLLAIAREAEVDFTMQDIDALSRKTPCLCKVAPSSSYHMEDVSRAGGIMSILGELDKADLLNTSVYRVDSPKLADTLDKWDIGRESACEEAKQNALSAPGGSFNNNLASQEALHKAADLDREKGCIRNKTHAYSQDGGLAVLFGNIAEAGCIVKTAGVDPSCLEFEGRARVFESQDDACNAILDGSIQEGDVVVIIFEGPKGGPGMQEMLYPTSYIKSMKLAKKCALITDGRFSGGTSGLSIGHVSPEAASGGAIGLLQDNDKIIINIPKRIIKIDIDDKELAERRKKENEKPLAWKPKQRKRHVSKALKTYALLAASADKGAVRLDPEDV